MNAPTRIVWSPQAGPQMALLECPYPEIFFGGARGGGKTDGVLGKYALKALQYGQAFNALFTRRELPMLDDAIERSKAIYGPIGGHWQDQQKTWRFPDGGRVRFRPLERVDDADKYQGQNITDVCVEEAGQYPDPKPIDRLHAVLRSAHGVPTQMILTGNPGGAGQQWIKSRYIDPAPPLTPLVRVVELPVWAGGGTLKRKSVYIPSRVSDNRFLDSGYVAGLQMVGSAALVRAWLLGDWSAVEGAFFDGWSSERHVVEPFALPEHWVRFRSFDWGFARPFSVGWWAVAGEPMALPRVTLPRGCMVRYREWYGKDPQEANTGIRMEAEDIAIGIIKRERQEKISMGVADTQIWAQEGKAYGYTGPTIGERVNKTLLKVKHAAFRPADKSRRQGWDQLRARLAGESERRPMLVMFNSCVDAIRTLPVLQHDTLDPEDLDTESEDHAADEVRYGVMARPWSRPAPDKADDAIKQLTKKITLRELVEAHDNRRGARI